MSPDDTYKPNELLKTGGEHDVICAVAYIELVDYAHEAVTEQTQIKARSVVLLARVLADIPASERIVVETVDGVAIIFLCSPVRCLGFGLALRAELASLGDERLRLRIGMNLGPVRMIQSIDGESNFTGDGLAGGERTAAFANVNEVVASHSFYEAIVGLSPEYGDCFAFQGERTDSRVREHRVYSLCRVLPPITSASKPAAGLAEKVRTGLRGITSFASAVGAHIMRRPQLSTALAVVLILVFAVGVRQAWQGADVGLTMDANAEAASGRPPISQAPPAPALQGAVVDAAKETNPATWALPSAPKSPDYVPLEPAAQPGPDTALAGDSPPRPQSPNRVVATGAVRLTIAPWGEIYLDGEKLGVSPPLRDIALEPGVYRIEIRNPGFASHLSVVEVSAGEEIRIRHRFD